ncbi:MAG TPA: BadF/BadG/BcrA/BcrD ATPase family protein, partial [Anaerolineales bacterium]
MTSSRKVFLGVDIGATNTRALLADEEGAILGFGNAGPGNHESVGYEGLTAALHTALDRAFAQSGLGAGNIHAAGFGIGGLDWDSQ